VPISASTVATTASGVTGASANLRFGMRTAAAQAAGTYVAPIILEVLAPSV